MPLPVYYLRYAAHPGYGEIVDIITTDAEVTVEWWQKANPKVFDRPGFYNVLRSLGDGTNIKASD